MRFREHLRRQLRFLDRSASAYDAGFQDEATRIATSVRVLLHDTARSTSLLKHLNATDITLLSPTLTQDELKERVGKLVEGLNANTARITAGIVDEEQSAGRTMFSPDRQPHVEAAQRLKDVLKQEHERFQSSLEALKEQAGK